MEKQYFKKEQEVLNTIINSLIDKKNKYINNNYNEDICENSNICVTKVVWERMKKGIEDVINSITLQDMMNDYNKNKLQNDITNLIIK